MIAWYVSGGIALIVILYVLLGINIIRPTEKALVERLGKYIKTNEAGFLWVFYGIDNVIKVNITEQMIDVPPQMVITKDKLNAQVDAVVYYQIQDVKASAYNVDDHANQLQSLARTTLRGVIGSMTLTEANENRAKINTDVESVLDKETDSYGVEVLRVEIQKIEPPQNVQEAMNEVVKAEQAKIAAKDAATAEETKADGKRRAFIKEAEGKKQASILEAEGKALAIVKVAEAKAKEIELENQAIIKNFKESAVDYKKLETAEKSLSAGSKYVIDSKSNITNVISEVAGITPIRNS